jgi:putative nucleotidyltransferase with HDIG domain
MSNELMDKIVRSIDDLPPMPSTIIKLSELIKNPMTSGKDIAAVISLDQALTTKILKWCNSPLYGLSKKITSVEQAAALLGNKAIQSLATACCANQIFDKELDGYMIDKEDLWKHSIGCAAGSQIIAQKKFPALRDTAFTAGLLHDLGKIILNNYVKDEFVKIAKIVEEEKIPFTEAENRVLGFDHTEIGAKAAEKWKLPQDLIDAIRYHHDASQAKENTQLVACVHLSNIICLMFGIGCGCDGLMCKVDENALKLLGIDEAEFEKISSEVLDSIQSTESLLD